jgi:hypothetical protein
MDPEVFREILEQELAELIHTKKLKYDYLGADLIETKILEILEELGLEDDDE